MKKSKVEEIKIEATLNCIKDSETILNGEYYVIHSDYIIALEEEIEKLNQPNIIVKVGDAKEIREKIELLQVLQSKIDKAIEYNKEVLTWTTNEPITDEIAYKNLEILRDKGEDK